METLFNGYTLQIAPGTFPLSTDSMALASFVRLPRNSRVLDLGAGCGTIGTLLCAKDAGCTVTGIELEETAHRTALENASGNGISHRLTSICADLRGISQIAEPGSFDICVSNPPYFSAGFLSQSTPAARHEQTCTLDELMASAAYSLKFGGDFYLVHKPERLSEIFVSASSHKLEPKRLCLLRHKADAPVNLVLVQLRKGGKPGLRLEELCLHGPDGTPTKEYLEIYHI
jgi:tRNA1Val (adenine37-N6)-methyltransferase